MDATPPATPSRGGSPRRFAGALLGLLHGHIALFGEELKEQQSHTLRLLVLASLSLVFGLLLMVGLSAALLISFWDSHRLTVIILLCAAYTLGLLVCLLRLLAHLRNAPPPFSASLEELARDREQLLP
ncbi:phage holin family protein [Pseudomonas sp. MMS21-TM103]|uniref:phage holin family protein n=1 Tax=Pseudomonas sp. MMS21 TM103 TaxID=2886506 RepID=UPI001EDD904E|nr:phage holin family protein [Pseudomonas sp. MMS21 TM103]MCG4455568.1 phage holin family protein [Pseudomonas sp. MMS21 TM103]